MNKTEHLLTCLIEECAEIQQAATKALRFGLDDGYLGADTTNAQDIARECLDFAAVVGMLEEERILKFNYDKWEEMVKNKKEKVLYYMEYAQKRETLQ